MPGPAERHDLREGVRSSPVVLIGRKRRAAIGVLHAGVVDVDRPIEVSQRQWTPEERIERTEDRRVDADAQSQGQHGHDDKARLPAKAAQTVPNVS